MNHNELARTVMERIEALARISEEPGQLTRTFCSTAMRQANELVAGWMREAGMDVTQDAIGNVIGRYPARDEHAKSFILGSHLDTVRDAGKFDGPLGVLTAIACVKHLHEQKIHLPFALEVVGFADEEGVRYQMTYLGSKALVGKLNERDLQRADANGILMGEAIRSFGGNPDQLKSARRDADRLLGYAEVHIEQGPVLEEKKQPVGVVSAIAGQTRIKAIFTGKAGHAGTTPMALRHDALAAAAQFIIAVESFAKGQPGLVATVGQIEAKPGASNVIPGEVTLSVDVRHADNGQRHEACAKLKDAAHQVGEKRGVTVSWEVVHETSSVKCSHELTALLAKAACEHVKEVVELPSGAGHDAAVMADIAPIAMLFVRCKGGISHHPDESVMTEDLAVAIAVMNDFLQLLSNQQSLFKAKSHA
ncbi:MAG TPA: allantoate amidohydrolase [Verrucomicrobiae bacterium]|nr:allantoate amidohydrolase [Verrucomicrobiae bacterium]